MTLKKLINTTSFNIFFLDVKPYLLEREREREL